MEKIIGEIYLTSGIVISREKALYLMAGGKIYLNDKR